MCRTHRGTGSVLACSEGDEGGERHRRARVGTIAKRYRMGCFEALPQLLVSKHAVTVSSPRPRPRWYENYRRSDTEIAQCGTWGTLYDLNNENTD